MNKFKQILTQYLYSSWNTNWTSSNYRITRFLILRLLGFIYFVAFLILLNQGLPLIGSDGLLPADRFLKLQSMESAGSFQAFWNNPTIFVFYYSDLFFQSLTVLGLGLSLLLLLGCSNAIVCLLLWFLYLCFLNVGQAWYGYGWEIQLLETGFLSIFLCPLTSIKPFPRKNTPIPVIWLFRWLTFRIMFGAGLIKIRGDECWTNLTCLYSHYETQPLPNSLSRYLHYMPKWFHQSGVVFNHFVELICPFGVFGPQLLRYLSGISMLLFQVFLIFSGNLSFLNWLTIIPILACFDDSFFKRLISPVSDLSFQSPHIKTSAATKLVFIILVTGIIILSYNPLINLFSKKQIMNTSFTQFHLVNTYGAFGSVGERRRELVIKGTSDPVIDKFTEWKEYDLKANPGPPDDPLPWVSPYHYRVDWQIWFAAMSRPERQPWMLHFVWKLLEGDQTTLSLIENNPFPEEPPHFIRVDLYEYEFTNPFQTNESTWKRNRIGSWLPPVSTNNAQLKQYLKNLKLLNYPQKS